MAVCPSCDSANPEGFSFCGRCGSPLNIAVCPSCGASNGTEQHYCGQCGAALDGEVFGQASGPAAGSAVEERKLATVMFADVVGFTSLAERTDPELVARMVDAAFRRLGEVVTDHGGTIDKFMGDSVMAVFGVPVAHDDDAERAVAAALAIRDIGGDLAFSIGVNSGEVMATAVGRAGDFTVIGDTVNVAARLEKTAGPGEVLCGRLTAELAGPRVRFREHQPALLKGKSEPVEVWIAESVRPDDAAWMSEGPPLIGRDVELAFLVSSWRRCLREGEMHALLLSGDAGSGKTRLVNELAQIARADGSVVRANYPPYGVMGGSRVAAEVIRQLGPACDPGVNARVRSVTGEVAVSLRAIDPAGLEQEQLWAFVALLQEKGREGPLLLALDDMHRCDDRTIALVSELANRVSGVPVLILLSGRTEGSDWMASFPTATTMRLAPLSRMDAVALASAFACQDVSTGKPFVVDRPLSAESSDFLADRSSGNPLYLRELIAMAHARGLFVDDGQGLRLAAHEAIPATLKALLAARLDALEPAQKLAIQYVSVLGDAANEEQVSNLGSLNAGAVLRSLSEAGFLRRASDGHYETADSLLGEVAYETLPRNARGDLHRRAAQSAVGAVERARHLDRAAEYLGDDEALAALAAEALADEGENFLESSRHEDALRVLERAVYLGCRRPSALFALAKVQELSGKWSEAIATLSLIEDEPSDPSIAIERDHTAANTMVFSDPAWSAPLLVDVADKWHQLGNIEKEAWARSNLGVVYFNMSRMPESAATLERALKLFEEISDEPGLLAASSFLCLVKPTDPRVSAWLARALESADAAGDRGKQLNTLTTLAWNHFFRSFGGRRDEVATAEGFATRLAELAEELGDMDVAMHGWSLLVVMARLSCQLGLVAERAAALQRIVGSVRRGDAWLGWAASFSGAVAAGAFGATPPFPPADSVDPVEAMALLIVSAELIMAGRPEEALARFEAAKRYELGEIGDLASVFRAYALVLAGRYEEAREAVEKAAAAARVLEATAVAAACRALAAELDSRASCGDSEEHRVDLPPIPSEVGSFSDLLIVRSHAIGGNAAAKTLLREAAAEFAMPGLALGV